MKFETKTLGTVRMKFRHQYPTVVVKNQNARLASTKIDVVQGETMCLLNLPTMPPDEYVIGKSYTHPQDSYNKETGRELALKRAIEVLDLDRSQGREIMSAYYSR